MQLRGTRILSLHRLIVDSRQNRTSFSTFVGDTAANPHVSSGERSHSSSTLASRSRNLQLDQGTEAHISFQALAVEGGGKQLMEGDSALRYRLEVCAVKVGY